MQRTSYIGRQKAIRTRLLRRHCHSFEDRQATFRPSTDHTGIAVDFRHITEAKQILLFRGLHRVSRAPCPIRTTGHIGRSDECDPRTLTCGQHYGIKVLSWSLLRVLSLHPEFRPNCGPFQQEIGNGSTIPPQKSEQDGEYPIGDVKASPDITVSSSTTKTDWTLHA